MINQKYDFGTDDFVRMYFFVHPVDNPVWIAPEALTRKPFNEKVVSVSFNLYSDLCENDHMELCFGTEKQSVGTIMHSLELCGTVLELSRDKMKG